MINLKTLITASVLAISLITSSAHAAERHYGYPDIKYTVKEPGFFTNYINSIVVPKNKNGAGVVLLPSCVGVQDWNISNLKRFANVLLENGYTVVTPDYNSGPRPNSRPWNCGRWRALQDMRLIKDIYDATNALSKIPGIDSNRIFTVGQSLGAQFGALAVGKMYVEFAEKNGWGPIPRAVIGLYGGCQYGYGLRQYLNTGINGITRPVLWIAGAEDKRSYKINGCSKEKEQRIMEAQPDSKFVVYKDATHCFDCAELNGFYNAGEDQTYYYNAEATRLSRIEVLKFMEKFK